MKGTKAIFVRYVNVRPIFGIFSNQKIDGFEKSLLASYMDRGTAQLCVKEICLGSMLKRVKERLRDVMDMFSR